MDKIYVEVLVDKKEKRVVFAESGCDFVDVLFSFLTLPLGGIVRLLGKHSGLGSLDNLYESVEQLAYCMHSMDCRDMLLHPRSGAEELCEDLKISIHVQKFTCKQAQCSAKSTCYYSYDSNANCGRCGFLMRKHPHCRKLAADKGGVFVNDRSNFMITDDLQVVPISFMKCCSVLEELGFKDACNLEKKVVNFGREEVLNLLRKSLVSNRVLTELCFPDANVEANVKSSITIKEVNKEEENKDDETEEEKTIVKLALNKKNNEVIFAEVGNDFINQLLSFLTVPFGSVFRLLANNVSLGGCISNLYSSVERMSVDCFQSENCRNMLLTPNLLSLYECKNQKLKVEEMAAQQRSTADCMKCYEDNEYMASFIEQNLKFAKGGVESGGGFVDDSRRFIVANNLQIFRLSFVSAIAKGIYLPISDLIEKDARFGNANVLSLLGAMLISKTVLTDVFSPKVNQTELIVIDALAQSTEKMLELCLNGYKR